MQYMLLIYSGRGGWDNVDARPSRSRCMAAYTAYGQP